MVVAYSISAKDYNSAFTMLDRMIAANEGDKAKNLSDAMGPRSRPTMRRKWSSITALGTNLTAARCAW